MVTRSKLTEVRVLVDGLGEADATEGAEHLEVVVGSGRVGLHVVELVELFEDETLVGAVLVQVALDGRGVGLIVAVRAGDTSVRKTLNGPAETGAIDDGAVDGQETTKVLMEMSDKTREMAWT